MRRRQYHLLVLGVALWALTANVSLIIGRDNSQPVALCSTTDSEGYSVLDALVASPWVKETQYNRLGSKTRAEKNLSAQQKQVLDVISGLTMAVCVVSLIILVILFSGEASLPIPLLVSAAGAQAMQIVLLVWLVGKISCDHTGALYGSCISFIGFVCALSFSPGVQIVPVEEGGLLFTLNY